MARALLVCLACLACCAESRRVIARSSMSSRLKIQSQRIAAATVPDPIDDDLTDPGAPDDIDKRLAELEKQLEEQKKLAEKAREDADKAQQELEKEQGEEEILDTMSILEKLDHVQVGQDKRGPLVPALVPKAGQTFEVMNREAWDLIESNAYYWNMVSIDDNGRVTHPDKWFAEIDGDFFGNTMGWKSTHVMNKQRQRLFTIHMTKHMWNPTRWTWSFRIAHPVTEEVLFTINKDWFGAGFFFARDEWRVYRGHYRDDDQVYYCVSSYVGYTYWCYHNKEDWSNSAEPRAVFEQSLARDLIGLPDSSTLKVKEGEDTALLLATTVIMDMVYEQEQANERARERAEQREKERERRRHHNKGSAYLEIGNNEPNASAEAVPETNDVDTRLAELERQLEEQRKLRRIAELERQLAEQKNLADDAQEDAGRKPRPAIETDDEDSLSETPMNRTLNVLNKLDYVKVGQNCRAGGPLVPALVPKAGQTFEVMNKEAWDLIESNAYHWNMVSIYDNGKATYPDRWFAEIDGDFFGNTMGWKTTYVQNKQRQRLFTIHMTKHMWDPTRWTWSFRIAHPVTDEVLFTINKDWFGAGLFFARDEWRVYRGRYRNDDEVYYCVSSYVGYTYWCYHSKEDWSHSREPRAIFEQSLARDMLGLPDSMTLRVKEGEDTALLLATTTIMDMVYEQEQANERARERAQRRREQERRRERRNRRHGGPGRRGSAYLETSSNATNVMSTLAKRTLAA